MSASQLPLLPQLNVILNLTPKELLNYCLSSREAYSACSLPEYVIPYVKQFGLIPEQIPGDTLEKKLGFLSDFNWDVIPGDTLQKKGQHIWKIMDKAKMLDLDIFVNQNYRGFFYSINIDFKNVLLYAVNTGNPRFVQYILDILGERVGRNIFSNYQSSFRLPLITALTMIYSPSVISPQVWYDIAKILLKYYFPKNDHITSLMYGDFLSNGDIAEAKGLSLIFVPSDDDFMLAVENGKMDIAQFLYDYRLTQKIDPNVTMVLIQHIYFRAIEDNNFPAVKVLSTFVRPTQDLIDFANNIGAVEIAAFLRTLV